MTTKEKLKGIIAQLIILAILIIFLVVLGLLKSNPNIAESWTRGFSRNYFSAVYNLSSHVSFSLTEIFFLILIIIRKCLI